MLKYTIILYLLYNYGSILSGIQVKMVPENFWGDHKGGNFTTRCNMSCVLAENPSQPDAVFFMSMGNGHITKAMNYKTNISIKIIGTREGQHYYSLHNKEYLRQHFQGTALFDCTSDIPWVRTPNMDEVKAIQMPKNPGSNISFVASNCSPTNNRNKYVKIIDKLIGVVSMGGCLRNTPWPKCEGRACTKVEAIRRYKIHLAFENGNSPRYVTWKIYSAYEAGILPVYMGTQYIGEVVPKGSYIDVADFSSPEELAHYLAKVLADDDLYNKYFEWKWKPFNKEFEERFRILWTVPFECRMCRYVEALQKDWEWDQLKQVAIIPQDATAEHSSEMTDLVDDSQNTTNFLFDIYKLQSWKEVDTMFYTLLCSLVFVSLLFLIFKVCVTRYYKQ